MPTMAPGPTTPQSTRKPLTSRAMTRPATRRQRSPRTIDAACGPRALLIDGVTTVSVPAAGSAVAPDGAGGGTSCGASWGGVTQVVAPGLTGAVSGPSCVPGGGST